ncbi:MAG: hypothetical protein SFW09_20565 [Hyphomicrobiaceae bacterium]|nr:hypothetical protein [Hyphomicrobiaceae bacterium]
MKRIRVLLQLLVLLTSGFALVVALVETDPAAASSLRHGGGKL